MDGNRIHLRRGGAHPFRIKLHTNGNAMHGHLFAKNITQLFEPETHLLPLQQLLVDE
jgi:hypothetical protein